MWQSWTDFAKWTVGWVKYFKANEDSQAVEIATEETELAALRVRMDALEKEVKKMADQEADDIAGLDTEFTTYQTAVTAALAEQNTQIAALQTELANAPGDHAAALALLAKITAATALLAPAAPATGS